jgi:asparagine synthetase B (glutamine-hydrolysing)
MLATAGVSLTEVVSRPDHALAASSGIERVGGRGVVWGRYTAARERPRDWQEAAQDLGLAGLWSGEQEVVLHTDVLGLNDIFVREVAGTTYFSNRMAPLRELTGDRLTTDWEAWGTSLVVGGFAARETPYREIRRLHLGDRVILRDGRVDRGQDLPTWLVDPGVVESPAGVDEVVDALHAALPRRFSRLRATITLSGGWDSRLLAIGLHQRHVRRPTAFTGPPDDGFLDDVVHAQRLAEALKLEQHVVTPRPRAWVRNRPMQLARVEHGTWMHTWLEPVARRVRAAGLPVYDGFGGDRFLRTSVLGRELPWLEDADDREAQLWKHLGGWRITRPGLLARRAADSWAESSRAAMSAATSVWSGHPLEYSLRFMAVRNVRAIAAAPMRMFAPDVRVIMPLADPRFVRVCLRVPTPELHDKAFNKRLLHALDPSVAALPSTNDGAPQIPSSRPPSQSNPAALRHIAALLDEDDGVRSLLDERLLRRLRSGDARRLRAGDLGVLHWAECLADWRRTQSDRVEVEPPQLG